MDKDNKLKTSLNAYMAKHQLNTNATSVAIGVSVPTLRKALRGEKVSRKTTAKIESIIASGKVPAGAATTKRTKKTVAKKPAAKVATRKTAAKTSLRQKRQLSELQPEPLDVRHTAKPTQRAHRQPITVSQRPKRLLTRRKMRQARNQSVGRQRGLIGQA